MKRLWCWLVGHRFQFAPGPTVTTPTGEVLEFRGVNTLTCQRCGQDGYAL